LTFAAIGGTVAGIVHGVCARPAVPHGAVGQPQGPGRFRGRCRGSSPAGTQRALPGKRRRAAGPPPLLEGLSVLVVEDHFDSRDMLRQMLQGFGARVLSAADGEEALAVLGRHRPDVILCDLVMPVMDGFHLRAALKRSPRWRRIPVIAVTALGGETDYRRTWEAGFDAHLAKPVHPDQVVAIVRAVTGRPPPPRPDDS
jgi:two-component system cell cycle response regulator DivK